MDSKLEEVKKIMETSSMDTKLQREIVAREICQLFSISSAQTGQGVITSINTTGASYSKPNQYPGGEMTEEPYKYNCPDDCTLKGAKCPIGIKCPPLLVRDGRIKNCPYFKPPESVENMELLQCVIMPKLLKGEGI